MRYEWRKWMAMLGATTLLVACGGGDGGNSQNEEATSVNQPTAVLQARVGSELLLGNSTVAAGSQIELDASASKTPTGTLSYVWRIVQQPGDAAIDNPTVAKTTFTPTLTGDYALTLTADNGLASATQQLNFSVTSEYPIAAVERREINMPLGKIQLDGRSSQPPTGGDSAKLVYAWTLVSSPPGSTATLDSAEAQLAQPRFTADVLGKYEFSLVVSYEDKQSLSAAVQQVTFVPPTTLPKAVITMVTPEPYTRGQKVTFSAADSTMGNRGTALQYRWSITYVDYTSLPIPALENANTVQMSFVPNGVTSYGVTLEVFDGVQMASTSTRIKAELPAGAANTPPVAVITHNSFELEKSAKTALDSKYSYDIDGELLTPEWTIISEPAPGAGSLTKDLDSSGFGRLVDYFTPRFFEGEGAEHYTLQLRVQDASGAFSEPVTKVFTVLNGANHGPSASATSVTGNLTVIAGNELVLSGESSTDADNNRLTYQWTLLDKPDGSSATLQNADQVRTTLKTDKAGSYKVTLKVTDSLGASASLLNPVTVRAKSQNYPPEVRPYQALPYDREQPLLIEVARTNIKMYTMPEQVEYWNSFLFYSNAYDPDGETVNYLWNLDSVPTGYGLHHAGTYIQSCYSGARYAYPYVETAQVWYDRQLNARTWASCANFGFSPSMTGIYDLSLWVSDGTENVGPFKFSVHAATRADYPTLLLENLQIGSALDNATQTLVVKSKALNNTQTLQVIFPATEGSARMPYSAKFDTFSGDFVLDTYRLTAASDYTITDLKAVDGAGRETLRFNGLQEGQVIRKGQAVEFQLVWNVATAPAVCETNPGYLAAKDFTWSFGIKEKPGYTFSYKPTNNLAACQ